MQPESPGVDRHAVIIDERRWSVGAYVVLAFERAWAEEAVRLLHPREVSFASRFGQERRVTWAAGRAALRIALSRSGVCVPDAVLPNNRGAPDLASGLCGSISHKRGLVAAAVRCDGTTIGIDVEAVDPPRTRIARRVLTPSELEYVSQLHEPERWKAIVVRFSLKEAIFKAMDPWLRHELGFQDVGLRPLPNGGVIVEHARTGVDATLEVGATWAVIGNAVVTVAECKPATGHRLPSDAAHRG